MNEVERYTLEEAQKEFAKQSNGRVWNLLAKTDRTPGDNEEMECAAFASLYHWLQAGTKVHQQRGEWLIAHVYTVLGEAESALKHASRCLEINEEYKSQMEDFDTAYMYEGMARANALSGNREIAEKYWQLAESSGEAISNEESREIFTNDLNGGDWYGINN
jgi:tetratricopeptide (TPR) repeat protein